MDSGIKSDMALCDEMLLFVLWKNDIFSTFFIALLHLSSNVLKDPAMSMTLIGIIDDTGEFDVGDSSCDCKSALDEGISVNTLLLLHFKGIPAVVSYVSV